MYDEQETLKTVTGQCPQCGSTLQFDPESQNLICENCGSIIPLEKKEETVEEYDFETYL